ncbi:hypothetical protein D3C73_1556850 [compost metagenome]
MQVVQTAVVALKVVADEGVYPCLTFACVQTIVVAVLKAFFQFLIFYIQYSQL